VTTIYWCNKSAYSKKTDFRIFILFLSKYTNNKTKCEGVNMAKLIHKNG